MRKAFVGESFELVFDFKDPQDPTRVVDSATFRVLAPDGSVAQAGTMSIDDGGKSGRFRFTASEVGVNTIEIAWSMGLDRFRQPHLISIEEIGA